MYKDTKYEIMVENYEIMKENAYTLAKRIDKVVEDLRETKRVNEKRKVGNNILINLDIDHINYWIDILEGVYKE